MPRLLCLNGPNLDLLGTRDPEIYGSTSLADLEAMIVSWGSELDCEVDVRQSNSEAELIDLVHSSAAYDGLLLNGGAFSHTSMALADAVDAVSTPMVEVHISHIAARERWRRRTRLASAAVRTISGRGLEGYRYGVAALTHHLRRPARPVRYGPHPDHVIDLWASRGAIGGAVLVHGGFWRDQWGRDTVAGWGAALADVGISAAAIGYRRLGSGGGIPATLSDVAEAVEVALGLVAGPWVLVGHSAGGHLAAWAGASGTSRPVATVGVGGIYDLRPEVASHLGSGAVATFSPDGAHSPILMDPPPGPVTLVHGYDDDRVPASQSAAYADVLERSGAAVTLDVVADTGHFEVLDTRSSMWGRVAAHVQQALSTADPIPPSS